MLATADWVSPVAALIGGAFGLAGAAVGSRISNSQRKLAERERVYEDLRNAYNLALAAMTRLEHQVDRVHRKEEPLPERPEFLQAETVAGVTTFGAEAVVNALSRAQASAEAFFLAAREGAEGLDARYQDFKAAVVALGATIRADLRDR